jgi:hypothetical protein
LASQKKEAPPFFVTGINGFGYNSSKMKLFQRAFWGARAGFYVTCLSSTNHTPTSCLMTQPLKCRET